jgi:hypothetical protein
VNALPELLRTVYANYAIEERSALFDVTVELRRVRGLRRWLRPQVKLLIDAVRELEPFPLDTPLPLLEWGMNYALASRLSCYLLLHSGAVERHGRAVLLPAMPGSGKSTLTAALVSRGYRLLSDEFGVVRLDNGQIIPLLKPLALKNESIDVIARFAPNETIGPRFPKTQKGTVAHLAPARRDVDARHSSATPGLVIFPKYDPTAGVDVQPVPGARAYARLAVNSFNYEVLGPDGFDAMGRLIQASKCYQLSYGDLEGAIGAIGRLIDEVASSGH